jgi:hypothetical protein
MYIWFLFNTIIYVFLLLCLCTYFVLAGTLRLPWLRFFRAFSSVVRQMPGYNSQRRGTARTLPNIFVLIYVLFVLCRSLYCLCVNVYCTNATGWQPNCSLTNIHVSSYYLSRKLIMNIVPFWIQLARVLWWDAIQEGGKWSVGNLEVERLLPSPSTDCVHMPN